MKQTNPQNGFAPIIILIGVLVLIGAAGGIYYLSKSSTSTSVTSQNQPDVTKNSGSSASTQPSNVPDGVRSVVDKANRMVVKTDLENLQQALNTYKKQKGSYPESLQVLKQSGFIPQLPSNPYTNSNYDYQTNGTTYTLSGKLGDGSVEKVSD